MRDINKKKRDSQKGEEEYGERGEKYSESIKGENCVFQLHVTLVVTIVILRRSLNF